MQNIKEKFNQLLQKPIVIPAVLLLLTFLAYGLLAHRMGFYWDDLPFAWFLRFFGPVEFIEAFRPFRPLLGPIFTVTTTLFGGHPLTWQILGLGIRFLLGLQVWWLLRQVFPTRQQSALWTVLLFTVYPAFGQQWVALTHVNQELIPLSFLLASFIITAYLLRNGFNSKRWIALAILLQTLGLFSTEYFFGLEILRFFFILAIFAETLTEKKKLLTKTFLHWMPYLIVWILNAAWTYAYYQSTSYESYEINIFSTLSPLALINEFITTLSLAGFTSWVGAFGIFAAIDGSVTQAIAFVILLLTSLIVYFVMQGRSEQHETQNQSQSWGWWAVTMGLAAIFAGRLPSWAAGLPLKIEFDYDRFFVSIMLGASLFIIGLADLTLREGRGKIILLSVLIGISTAYQFSVANTFRRDWANQQDLFWQMAWRMPALKENTAILTYELPLKYAADLQLTAGLNWMYAPDLNSRDLPYTLLYLKTRFTPAEIRAGNPLDVPYRTVSFRGNTTNSVVIYKEAGGCLRVLDPLYNTAETVPGASFYLINAIPLSNLELILTKAPAPKMEPSIFGSEPKHGWCYTYTQAEIARQQGNWEEAANLYREAQKENLNPALPVEYLPFIEAFAMTGDINTAIKLTERAIKGQPTLCPALHTLWERVSETVDISDIGVILQKGCAP
ncbi:MAG: hypothetical protein Q8L87_14315 [Anaerolineales bacterium]|nr:hypothetical protein [Anaerolineales bacterium]